MSVYDIRYELQCSLDGDWEYGEAKPKYGMGAIYGDGLKQLVDDLDAEEKRISDLEKQLKEKDNLQKELDQLKEELAKAFVGGIDIETTQGKRLAYPGLIVMYKSPTGVDTPAIVLEVCGFPQGKLGLRTFAHNSTQDRFVYAAYAEQGVMIRTYGETWRFID